MVKEAPTALNLYETGEVDDTYLSGELAQQMQNSPDLVQLKAASSFYLEMNQADEKSPLTNANLRRAMSYAIDRDSLAKNILANGSFLHKASFLWMSRNHQKRVKTLLKKPARQISQIRQEKAVEYWNKAKQELGVSNLTVDLMVDDSEGAKKWANIFKDHYLILWKA